MAQIHQIAIILSTLVLQLGYGLDCYTCTPQNTGDCVTSLEKTEPCKNKDDSCFVASDKDKTYRGCSSDLDTKWTNSWNCSTDKCNDIEFPLKCFECNGDDCRRNQEKWKISVCPVQNLNDYKCFSKVYNGNQVERGCYTRDSCDNNIQCRKCNPSQCNNEEFLTCYHCDEEKDESCRNDLSHAKFCATDLKTCNTCETRTNAGYSISRGCIKGLKPSCTSCTADNCNGQIPLNCYNCSSNENQNCARLQDISKVSTITCDSVLSSCMTKTENGTTVRKCGDAKDCSSDPNNCKSCTDNLCNKDVLSKDTIKCYVCGPNESCDRQQQFKDLQICPKADLQTKCFAYLNKDIHMIRGCTSDNSGAKECATHGDNCVTSNYDGSNGFSLYQSFSCVACEDNIECPWSQKDSKNTRHCGFRFNETASCYTGRKDNGVVVRGCLHENSCENLSNCQSCNKANCNAKSAIIQKCVQCDSSKNDDCFELRKTASQVCSNEISRTDQGCFVKYVDNVLTRGCVSNLTQIERGECEESTNCRLCDGEGCNKLPDSQMRITCYSCSSDKNPKCAKEVTSIANIKELCPHIDDKCIATIQDNVVVRGCTSQYQCNVTDENCQICSEGICNDMRFPPAKCYQCSESPECDRDQSSNRNLRLCKNSYDKCFNFIKNGQMVRGCTSDYSYKDCKKSHKNYCTESEGHGSNFRALVQLINCYECDQSDPNCVWDQSRRNTISCRYEFFETPKCYIYENPTTSVQRGCVGDSKICIDNDDPKCIFCEESFCNLKNTITQNCVQCISNSTRGTYCRKSQNLPQPTECKNLQSYGNRGCFTKVSGKTVWRGCVPLLTDDELKSCLDKNQKKCQFCEGNGCNNMDVRNGSEPIMGLSGLLIGLLAIIVTNLI